MAKHGRKRRYDPLRFTLFHPLGALGSLVVSGARTMGSDLEENYFVNSVESTWTIKDYTITPTDGPIMVGYYHNDYSVAEVKEALEVILLGPANKIEQERMRRLVRIVGIISPREETAGQEIAVLNDGQSIKTKLNWTIQEGQSLNMFVYNMGAGPVTTGASLDAAGRINGRWLI